MTVADRVIAIDPAALAPEVAALPNLRMQSVVALAIGFMIRPHPY